MTESRLSIVIDSRSAEQQARDLERAMLALEQAGVRVTGTSAKAGAAFDKAGDHATASAAKTRALKTSLSDARSAAVSLRGALTGAFLGVSFTAMLTKVVRASNDAQRAQEQLAAVLKSTGHAAGFTRDELNEMGRSLASVSTHSADAIALAQTRLLAYSGIAHEVFPRSMQAVIDTAARMGMSVEQAAETVGRALDIPSEGLSSLSRQGFRFTEEQKALVKQLEATGQTAKAQAIVLEALESSYGGAALAARNTLGGAMQALSNQIDDLMTGDAGSVNGLTESINELTNSLGSEQARYAFQAFAQWTIEGAAHVAELAQQFALGIRFSDGFFDAIGKYGLTNPWKSASEQLARVRTDLEEIKKLAEDPVLLAQIGGETGLQDMIRSLKQQEGYWQEMVRLEQLKNPFEANFPQGNPPRLSPVTVTGNTLPSNRSGAPKVDKDPLGTFINELNINYAVDQYQRQLNFIDEITGQAQRRQIEQQRLWLDEAMSLGDITTEQYDRAMREIAKSGVASSDQMGQFAIQAARNIQGVLGDGLYSLLQGNFDGIAQSWGNMLMKMAADAAAANLAGALFGNYDQTGQIGGILGGVASSLFGPAAAPAGVTPGVDWTFSAKGNVFDSPSLSRYSNQIHDTPKMFGFAKGAGVFAEAGPEAIMPLKRGPDGTLGVRVHGGAPAQPIQMKLEIINPPGIQLRGHDGGMSFNGKEYVQTVILEDIRNGGPIAQTLRGGQLRNR